MKILIVTGIFPPDHGGPASYVPAIASALVQDHEIVAVVTLSDNAHHDDSEYAFSVVRINRNLPRLVRLLKTIATIRKLSRRADVAYLNGLVLEGIIACKLLSRRPVAVKVVGDLIWEKARNQAATNDSIEEFQTRAHPFKWRLLRMLQTCYTRTADLVIVPSEYLAGIVLGWGIAKTKVAVVYNAVHIPRESPIEPTWDLVTVARLVAWKGIDQLIQLAADNGWSLKIVGDGPLRASLEAMAESLATKTKIVFTGHVMQREIVQHIRSARVFVLNSSYEGLPHIVLEAKAAGVAVVASAVGGTPESINDGIDGFLYRLNDIASLTRIIKQLLDNAEFRRTIAQNGREDVLQRFSFDRMVLDSGRLLVLTAKPCFS